MEKSNKDELTDLAKEKAETAKKAVSDMTDKMKNISAEEAKELAKEKAEMAKKAVSDMTDKMKNISTDDAKELAKDNINKIKSLDKSSITKLLVAGLVIISMIAFKFISSNKAEEKIDEILTKLPANVISYESASVDFIGFNVHIHDISIDTPNNTPVFIDEIVINSIDKDNEIPEFIDIAVNGIEGDMASLKLNSNLAHLLDVLEQKELKSDFTLHYEFDKETGILSIPDVSIDFINVGKLSFNAKVHDVQSLQEIPMQLMMVPDSLKVSALSLTYVDDSLSEGLFKIFADQANISVDDYKKNLQEKLVLELEKAEKKDNEYETELITAVMAYIESPESIELSISPDSPVPIMSMKTNKNFLEDLNFELSVN